MSEGLRLTGGTSLETLARELRALGSPATRQRCLGVIARELSGAARTAFSAQAAPSGTPWAALAKPRARPILQVSGALLRGATSPVFRGNTVAFALPFYGKFHQEGRAHLPARPFIPVDPLPLHIAQRISVGITRVLDEQLR